MVRILFVVRHIHMIAHVIFETWLTCSILHQGPPTSCAAAEILLRYDMTGLGITHQHQVLGRWPKHRQNILLPRCGKKIPEPVIYFWSVVPRCNVTPTFSKIGVCKMRKCLLLRPHLFATNLMVNLLSLGCPILQPYLQEQRELLSQGVFVQWESMENRLGGKYMEIGCESWGCKVKKCNWN